MMVVSQDIISRSNFFLDKNGKNLYKKYEKI